MSMPPLSLSMSPLTPLVGQPAKTRFAFYALRFLAWSNGLESFVNCVAIAYAMGFLLFGAHPAFANAYPLAQQVAFVLGITGFIGVLALNRNLRLLRIVTSLIAFLAWGLLALGAGFGDVDLQRRGALVLAVFALGELAVFMRLHLGMEQMRDTLDAAAFANNLSVFKTGQPLPPTIPAEQDNGSTDRPD